MYVNYGYMTFQYVIERLVNIDNVGWTNLIISITRSNIKLSTHLR